MSDQIVSVRKAHAGSDSHGHEWPVDGAVVQMPWDEAVDLLGIAGGGFTIADTEVEEPAPDAEVTEPAPEDEHAVSEHPRRGGRRPRAAS